MKSAPRSRSSSSDRSSGPPVLINGAQMPKKPSLMENRLHAALTNLRSQCRVISGERVSSTNVRSSSSDLKSQSRTRDLQRLLVQARSNEADLQDDVDTMKCEIAEHKFRVKELEAVVDDWRDKCERESAKVKAGRDELEARLGEARQQIYSVKESCNYELMRKDDEIAQLSRQLSELQTLSTGSLRVDSCTQTESVSAPPSPVRQYAPLTFSFPPPRKVFNLELVSSTIPDLGRSFSSAATSPLFRLF